MGRKLSISYRITPGSMPAAPGYWMTSLLENQLPRRQPHRYLAFDIDQGGLNNIRLVFEYASVLAAITGRTLVLPPAVSWYLVNHGPAGSPVGGGVTAIGEVFDLAALGDAIPLLETESFVAEAGEHLGIPDSFRRPGVFTQGGDPDHAEWRRWLAETAIIPGWNPYDTLVCYPDIDAARSGPHLDPDYVDGRELVEFTPRMNAAPLIYLPSTARHRSLGPVATMLASDRAELPMLCRRLLKHHVRYRPEIFERAASVIEVLGVGTYDALHVRRNDFQYRETRLAAADIHRNVRELFNADGGLYLATDDEGDELLREFETCFGRRVQRWQDVVQHAGDDLPFAWVGPVEQLVCAAAREFAGTDLSTFTGYIHRLRGYFAPESATNHYHGELNGAPSGDIGEFRYRGREYLRENPLFWLAC